MSYIGIGQDTAIQDTLRPGGGRVMSRNKERKQARWMILRARKAGARWGRYILSTLFGGANA
jgi:hypothetical protein